MCVFVRCFFCKPRMKVGKQFSSRLSIGVGLQLNLKASHPAKPA